MKSDFISYKMTKLKSLNWTRIMKLFLPPLSHKGTDFSLNYMKISDAIFHEVLIWFGGKTIISDMFCIFNRHLSNTSHLQCLFIHIISYAFEVSRYSLFTLVEKILPITEFLMYRCCVCAVVVLIEKWKMSLNWHEDIIQQRDLKSVLIFI